MKKWARKIYDRYAPDDDYKKPYDGMTFNVHSKRLTGLYHGGLSDAFISKDGKDIIFMIYTHTKRGTPARKIYRYPNTAENRRKLRELKSRTIPHLQ